MYVNMYAVDRSHMTLYLLRCRCLLSSLVDVFLILLLLKAYCGKKRYVLTVLYFSLDSVYVLESFAMHSLCVSVV